MFIDYINIQNIRIIDRSKLNLNGKFNIISGINASGKTSILEAVTILATGKSFRTNRFEEVISHCEERARVVGKIGKTTVGVERSRDKKVDIHINHRVVQKRSQLSNYLITQVVTPKVSDLIEAGSSVRRNFLDWGLFHVKPSSREQIKRFKRILQQRNALLKNSTSNGNDILIWDKKYCEYGEALSLSRAQYLQDIVKKFNQRYIEYTGLRHIDISYYKGWPLHKSLVDTLRDNVEIDKRYKTTKAGPHVADFRISITKHRAKQILSRGQFKLVSLLLRLAQLELFCEKTQKPLILLIDDINSELDQYNQEIVLNCINNLNIQTVFTVIDPRHLPGIEGVDAKMFHVEQGKAREI